MGLVGDDGAAKAQGEFFALALAVAEFDADVLVGLAALTFGRESDLDGGLFARFERLAGVLGHGAAAFGLDPDDGQGAVAGIGDAIFVHHGRGRLFDCAEVVGEFVDSDTDFLARYATGLGRDAYKHHEGEEQYADIFHSTVFVSLKYVASTRLAAANELRRLA